MGKRKAKSKGPEKQSQPIIYYKKRGGGFAKFIAFLAVLTSLGLGSYILMDKGIVNISVNLPWTEKVNDVDDDKVEDDIEEWVKEVSEEDIMTESKYGYGYVAYLNHGEVYTMYYDGTEQTKITQTDGKVTEFEISPDNNRILYQIGETIFLPDEYIGYYEELTGKDKDTILRPGNRYDLSLHEIDLITGDATTILDRLDDEVYYADMLLAAIDGSYDYFSDIDGVGYHPSGKYLVYSRDDTLSYTHSKKDFTKLDNAIYILKINDGNTYEIPDTYFAYESSWSENGKYLILSFEESTAMNWSLYDVNSLLDIKQMREIDHALYGHRYIFKGLEGIVSETGEAQAADFTHWPVYREIDLITDKVIVDKTDSLDNTSEIIYVDYEDKEVLSQSPTYEFTTALSKKYVYRNSENEIILFDFANSEFSQPGYDVYNANIKFAFSSDLQRPQLVGVIENIYFSNGDTSNLKVYDLFEEAEPFELEISQGHERVFSSLEFFVDKQSVQISEY